LPFLTGGIAGRTREQGVSRRRAAVADNSAAAAHPAPALRVLIVDGEAQSRRAIARSLRGSDAILIEATTSAEAREQIAAGCIDLALIDEQLPDGSGIALTQELQSGRLATQAVVIAGHARFEVAVEALRAGAADVITKPFKPEQVRSCLGRAAERQRSGRAAQQRIQRLRRICKKLTASRDEITQQVDVLCSDLVAAYQELATQMHQAVQTTEFAAQMGNELDLEALLRKTLEYLLQKAGPTNAAIFLPCNGDEYSLGGYVNYDCTSESADILLQHLADVLAPRLAKRTTALHVTDNATLTEWIGDDAAYLEDAHVVAFPCRHDGEVLAAVALFRDGGQPFDSGFVEACNTVGPLLADFLARIIRIHHRHHGEQEEEREAA
jgi:FixJ family two-component response regulator